MRAQVAVEYMILIGFVLMILIPFTLYSYDLSLRYSEEKAIRDARDSVEKLGQLSDWICSQGPPAKVVTQIYIPNRIETIEIHDRIINFKLRVSSGVSDVYYITTCNVSGTLPLTEGYINAELEARGDGVVIEVAS